ncbi:NACHT, LRR and PYD domains-containing protein 3-like isoform X2 [Cololabis saira]|uniref:NACHT, LRR and PYD domains-containing protein 3-like isoform X2 n=1 Tax=Cololabis saira TaxID=129043 RepID=UPI002AD3224B|nr:NACHT, LRR and PYD domains-containing protein 3-like isoform X2 [Cololabis saira]
MKRRRDSQSSGDPAGSSSSSSSSSSSDLPDRSQSDDHFPKPSGVSVKSEASMGAPLTFRENKLRSQSDDHFPKPSGVSVKSEASMGAPLTFGEKKLRDPALCSGCKESLTDPVQLSCGHSSCKECLPLDAACPKCGKKPKNIPYDDRLGEAKKKLKKATQKKYTWTQEGNGDPQTSLESIYTSVHITAGESEELSGEHESRHLQPKLSPQACDETINIGDMFTSGREEPRRTVLTKGIAGIGKSFSVQKFLLDWAQDKHNQDADLVFCLSFRELSLIGGERSLQQLLVELHPSVRQLKEEDYTHAKVIVILDGLDESRLQLDFKNTKVVTSASAVTSVSDLLVNLIQGNLLPGSNLWITSRPAAALQIAAELVHMVTEIRGFNDPQKDEYFRKRFVQDPDLAQRVTTHVRSSPTLDIMCQIPIFCWISATLFKEVFGGEEETEIPQTLTEMMAYFLFAQTKRRSRKYDRKTEKNKEKLLKTHREFLLKLGKLAFVQLQENKLIFYQEDLEECGVDVSEASIYSGFCNTVLREEQVLSQKKVFFFVHLTVQEFFAALYVYECFTTKDTKELRGFLNLQEEQHALLDLLKMTVDKVMEKKNGHLDFFLRFLLGLMVEPNRRVLQGLLTPQDPAEDAGRKMSTYLGSIRGKNRSPDSCINLFQSLVEMRDHRVKDEIQEYLREGGLERRLTPLHCSALAYVLLVSKDELEVLDLRSYKASEEGRRRLIPAVRSSRKALLRDCRVTAEWVKHLAFGLKFPFSPLRHLDLSDNDLGDSGVKELCGGLANQSCRLETLSLSGCQVTAEGCRDLVSALTSNPSHLTELDLSYNHPGDSGVKMLSELVEDQRYRLRKLRTQQGGSHRLKPGLKKYACQLSLDPSTAHGGLVLSEENTRVSWGGDQAPQQPDRPLPPPVLCEQPLRGRCYFEVEKAEPFSVGVTYRGPGGARAPGQLGHTQESWSLSCSGSGCHAHHGGEGVCVSSLCLRCSRLGVYLDWEGGHLSFYRVSSGDSPTLLHTFTHTFTQDLYAALELQPNTQARLCSIT